MKEKKEIALSRANRIVNHGPVVLVTCKGTKANIFTVAWVTPVSHEPPLVGISSDKENYSTEIIKTTGYFTINVPDINLKEAVIKCGTLTGKTCDKFKEAGITPLPGKKIDVPAIEECIGHIECKVINSIEAGDHIFFIGEAVSVYVDPDKFDFKNNVWIPQKACIIHHFGGNIFGYISKTI